MECVKGNLPKKYINRGETLMQVRTFKCWQKLYSNLLIAFINGNGEKEICTYYVKEILIADYSTSYSNGSVGEMKRL